MLERVVGATFDTVRWMPLQLSASAEVKQFLRDLKSDSKRKADWEAVSARVTALRHDPGEPLLRGKAYRVLGGETVRVSTVYVEDPSPHVWHIAWTVSPEDLPGAGGVERPTTPRCGYLLSRSSWADSAEICL